MWLVFGPILIFWVFFEFLLDFILNNFENNVGRFLMFWAFFFFFFLALLF